MNDILGANQRAFLIDNKISEISKEIRELYAKRFPELDSLVLNPLEYITIVKELGNEIVHAKQNPV